MLVQLVGELAVQSEEFRSWWADHRVAERRNGIERLGHPWVGRLEIRYEALAVTGEPDRTLFIYTTEPGSESGSRLRTLAGWVYPDPGAREHPGARADRSEAAAPEPGADPTGR